jgi:GNAT superfamily N-acetyltransferase
MQGIERVDTDGWRVYRDLRLAALRDAPQAFGARLEIERGRDESDWRERLASRTQFVALGDGGRLVGTVGARQESEEETELVSMWVAPEVRGIGVADQLVAAVIDEARACGSVRVLLCRTGTTVLNVSMHAADSFGPGERSPWTTISLPRERVRDVARDRILRVPQPR